MSESKFKTMRHIETVRNYLDFVIVKLLEVGNRKPVFPKNPTLIDHLIEINVEILHPYNDFRDIAIELLKRAKQHDQSKLQSPEVEIFEEYTPKLRGTVYGSNEYRAHMKGMKVAIDHHNENNRHHPEHHENGISDMTTIDHIEMICDWKSASLRHDTGDIMKSIEINQERFGYSDDLKQVFINTAKMLNESDVYHKANES